MKNKKVAIFLVVVAVVLVIYQLFLAKKPTHSGANVNQNQQFLKNSAVNFSRGDEQGLSTSLNSQSEGISIQLNEETLLENIDLQNPRYITRELDHPDNQHFQKCLQRSSPVQAQQLIPGWELRPCSQGERLKIKPGPILPKMQRLARFPRP